VSSASPSIKVINAATAAEFWNLLSPEKPLFPAPCILLSGMVDGILREWCAEVTRGHHGKLSVYFSFSCSSSLVGSWIITGTRRNLSHQRQVLVRAAGAPTI